MKLEEKTDLLARTARLLYTHAHPTDDLVAVTSRLGAALAPLLLNWGTEISNALPRVKITARSTVFSSSRTLPGHTVPERPTPVSRTAPYLLLSSQSASKRNGAGLLPNWRRPNAYFWARMGTPLPNPPILQGQR